VRIIDPDRLLPNEQFLREVISSHPLNSKLADHLDTVEVFLSEQYGMANEQIETYLEDRKARLGLGRSSKNKINFRCILYHEFTHFADRVDPAFSYSEDLKTSFGDPEQVALMDLWNVFIDSRLNKAGVFVLEERPPSFSQIHGWIPNTVEGKLQDHAVRLENVGVPYEKAMETMTDCWRNPPDNWSYEGMSDWLRCNIREQRLTPDETTHG
jgi:hypothetical protein